MPIKSGIDLNDTSNRIIVGIVIALIFVGGWWLIARNASESPVVDQESGEVVIEDGTSTTAEVDSGSVLGSIPDDTATIVGSKEFVEIVDQSAGMSVKVKSATLVQIGWIAVRDTDGRTLGAGRFEPGSHANVEVPLLRATEKGERYQVLIYVDDGDKAFDLHQDILVTGGDGTVAGDVFSAQ